MQNRSVCQKPLEALPNHQPSPNFQHHALTLLVLKICINVIIVCVLFRSIFFFARFTHIGVWNKYFHPMHITLFIYLTVDIHLWLIAHFQFNAITNITPVDCLMDTIGGRTPFLRTPFPMCFGSIWEGGSEAVAELYSQQKVLQDDEAAPSVGCSQAC